MTWLYRYRGFFLGCIGSFAARQVGGWVGWACWLIGIATAFAVWYWPAPRDSAFSAERANQKDVR